MNKFLSNIKVVVCENTPLVIPDPFPTLNNFNFNKPDVC